MTKELNEKDLEQVTGGVLTKEAEEWISRNKAEVERRSYAAGYNSWIDLLYVVLRKQGTIYDVDGLKNVISEQFNVNDLK